MNARVDEDGGRRSPSGRREIQRGGHSGEQAHGEAACHAAGGCHAGAQQQRKAQPQQDAQTVPVVDGIVEVGLGDRKQTTRSPLVDQARKQTAHQGQDSDGRNPEGEPVGPPRRGCPARGNDNQDEHAQVEHHAVELAEGELGAVGPDEGKPGGEPERRERRAGHHGHPRDPLGGPEQHPHAERERPPDTYRHSAPDLEAVAAALQREQEHGQRDRERQGQRGKAREDALPPGLGPRGGRARSAPLDRRDDGDVVARRAHVYAGRRPRSSRRR